MKRRSEKGSHSLHARVCTCVGVRGLQEMQVCKIPLFFLQLGKNIFPVRKKKLPYPEFNKGNVYVSTKQATQREKVDTAIAIPRIRFGKISDNTTHVTGASVIA